MNHKKTLPSVHRITRNQDLFTGGGRSDYIYRLITGEAVEAGKVLGPGEFVGEIGVLVGCARSATVTVSAGTSLAKLTRSEFLTEILSDRDLALRLLQSLSLRCWALMEQVSEGAGEIERVPAAATDRSFGARCVHTLAKAMTVLAELLRRHGKFIPEDKARLGRKARIAKLTTFEEVVVAKGDVLFEEGTASECVYLIKSGVLHITKRGTDGRERIVGRPRKGDVVGEVGVIEALPRTASARAVTKVVAQVLPSAAFFQLVAESPAIYLQVIDALCERARFLMRELRRAHASQREAPSQERALILAICSMESAGRLAEQRFANELLKMRRLFSTQVLHGKEIVQTYRKHSRGEASSEELDRANAHFLDYLKLAGLGALLVLPGAPISIPLASKMGKALGIDIFPAADDGE